MRDIYCCSKYIFSSIERVSRPLICASPVNPWLERKNTHLSPFFDQFKFILQTWPWTDPTHISSEDIDNLRQLIKRKSSQPRTSSGVTYFAI